MATITYKNVGIRAIAACVPSKTVYNKDLGYLIPEEEIEKTIRSTGIREKRFVEEDVCASDLCLSAAEKLLKDNHIDKASIDMLLFLSQTADYRIPATSPILQHRLGLSHSTACLDLTLGCSGYVYALSTAFAFAASAGINRVLLLVGETFSKITSPCDKVNAPLYGDAGTATLIEKGDFGMACFELCSDGDGAESVMMKAGGCRFPTTTDNLQPKMRKDGSKCSDNHIYMDGMDVFNFALKVVPKSVKNMAVTAGIALESLDCIVFHQANRFMTDFFIKKLKIMPEKVPYCMDRYGNTSSASIPLTIVSELSGVLDDKSLLICGFGAGLSWGTAYLRFSDCRVSPLIEYQNC
ncbi:MAG: ketoacyl-ACP synthase III [Tannerella sp.]|nr:ketoacyl-ACP synthase III [Tannerella sp.]